MQLRAWVWPGSRSPELQSTLPRTTPDLSMNLKWIKAVDVSSLTFLTLPVTLNPSPKFSCSTCPPASVWCLPTVNALPGVTSRGAFLSTSACCDCDASVETSSMALPAVLTRAAQPTIPTSMTAKMTSSTISHVRRFFGGCGGWPYGGCTYGPVDPGIYGRGGPGVYGPGVPGKAEGVVIGGSCCGEAGARCSVGGLS